MPAKEELNLLQHETEKALIKKLLAFQGAITAAAVGREPHKLITYLNELASAFTSFYHDCRMLGESTGLIVARASLGLATATVLAIRLAVSGMEAPDRE